MTTSTRFTVSLLATALVLAFAGTAQAAGGGAQKLQAADTNHDHQLSRAEAQSHPHLAKNFDAIDTNHDGQLSTDELKAWRAAHKGKGAHAGASAATR